VGYKLRDKIESLRTKELQGLSKHVMAILAKYADDKTGNNIFPYIETIAGDMGRDKRTVRLTISKLEKDGLITKYKIKRRNHYTINWMKLGIDISVENSVVSEIKEDHRSPSQRIIDPLTEDHRSPISINTDHIKDQSVIKKNFVDEIKMILVSEAFKLKPSQAKKVIDDHGVHKVLAQIRNIEELERARNTKFSNRGAYLMRVLYPMARVG
jgi:DNA-binding Lrp family transcriptional regulator